LGLRWQDAVKDLHAVRDPLEKSFFDDQAKIEKEALEIYRKNPKKAKQFLTDYSNSRVNQTMAMYEKLKKTLISKYTNNNQGL